MSAMISSRLSRLVIPALVFAITLSGCLANVGWRYDPNQAIPSPTHLPLTLAVEHFQDQRATANSSYFMLCLMPVIPYCTADYNRPEANNNGFITVLAYNFRPDADLAEATATELRRTAMFHDVYVTDGSADPKAELILRGSITETRWQGTVYNYLLGVYRYALYFLALPMGAVKNTLRLQLRLVRRSNGQVLWTYNINQTYTKTEALYYNFGQDFGYPEMLRAGIKPAIESLQQFIASQPASYWDAMTPAGTATHATN